MVVREDGSLIIVAYGIGVVGDVFMELYELSAVMEKERYACAIVVSIHLPFPSARA